MLYGPMGRILDVVEFDQPLLEVIRSGGALLYLVYRYLGIKKALMAKLS